LSVSREVPVSNRVRRSDRREATRNRLIDAATALARTRGLGSITIESVAEEAGLTSGAIYSNFASKEELLLDVARRLTESFHSSPLADAVDLPDLLRRGVDEVIAYSEASDDLALALEFYALSLRNPKLRQTVRSYQREASEPPPLQAWAERRGITLDGSAVSYARALDALSLGLAVQRAVHGDDVISDDVIEWALARFE
jgi:AcrR family transcriptional regulator